MSFVNISKTRNAAGKAISQAWGDDVVDDLEFLNGQIGTLESGQVLNGSFEINTNPDEPNIPDNWARTLFPGGTGVIDTVSPRHGAQIYKFTHPGGAGNGGGKLTSDYIETTPDRAARLGLTFWATIAALRIQIQMEYFTDAQVTISTQTLYNLAAGNPTSATRAVYDLTIPATARFMKISLIGGDTDTDPGASADIYFDDLLLDFTDNGGITQAQLKTSQGEVSTASTTVADLTLPGGEYGFYPRIKMNAATSARRMAIPLASHDQAGVNSSRNGWTAYATNISMGVTTGTVYAQQRYVTSSGEIYWIFLLRDKTTKEIISAYQAPDHPCFGNGGDPDKIPHPFLNYDETSEEIVVIQAPQDVNGQYPEWIEGIKFNGRADGRGILQTMLDDYDVDEDSEPVWDARPITVGLDTDDPRPGIIARTVKKVAAQRPEFIHRSLKLKAR